MALSSRLLEVICKHFWFWKIRVGRWKCLRGNVILGYHSPASHLEDSKWSGTDCSTCVVILIPPLLALLIAPLLCHFCMGEIKKSIRYMWPCGFFSFSSFFLCPFLFCLQKLPGVLPRFLYLRLCDLVFWAMIPPPPATHTYTSGSLPPYSYRGLS